MTCVAFLCCLNDYSLKNISYIHAMIKMVMVALYFEDMCMCIIQAVKDLNTLIVQVNSSNKVVSNHCFKLS